MLTAPKTNPDVVIVPTQGFCNRLRVLASAHILAQQLNTKMYVLWNKEDCCNCEWDDIFLTTFDTVSLEEVSKVPHLFNPGVHTNTVLQTCKDLTVYKYIVVIGGHEFKLPHMSVVSFLQHKMDFYRALRFVPEITERVNAFTTDKGFESEKVVGIHFRDFVPRFDTADQYNFAEASPVEKFVQLVKRVSDAQPDARFFVSSNTTRAYEAIAKVVAPGRAFCFENKDERRDAAQGIVHAVCDLLALSRCAYVIGTYSSSFSDEACFFRGISKLCVRSEIGATTPMAAYHCHGFAELWGHPMLLPDVNILFDIYKEERAPAVELTNVNTGIETVHHHQISAAALSPGVQSAEESP